MPSDSSELPQGASEANSATGAEVRTTATRRSLRMWRLGQLLLLLLVVFLLATTLLPAIRRVGPVSRISECRGNLKAICRAVRQYADEYGAYPPAFTVDAEGRRLHSWRTLLLPYLGQQSLYDQIDLSQPWHAAVHDRVRATVVPAYHCPSLEQGSTKTGYLSVVTDASLLGPGRSIPAKAVERPLDKLLICIEVNAERTVHWMSPFDLSSEEFIGLKPDGDMSHVSRDQPHFFYYWANAEGRVSALAGDTSADERREMISAIGREPSEVQE